MATFQWVVREVDRELATAVVDAAKRQGQKTGDMLNAIIRAWIESGGGASPPADDDLRTAVAQLAQRVEALEARQERRGASKPERQAELYASRQDASSAAPSPANAITEDQRRRWFKPLSYTRLSDEGKAEILRRLDAGQTEAEVGRAFGITQQGVNKIRRR